MIDGIVKCELLIRVWIYSTIKQRIRIELCIRYRSCDAIDRVHLCENKNYTRDYSRKKALGT